MSASQPLTLVNDIGELTSNNTTSKNSEPFIIRTGVLYVCCNDVGKGGHIGICNTTSDPAGISSFHINPSAELLYRYAHPAKAVVTGIQTGSTTVLTLNHPDTKLRVGNRVTLIGSSVAAYNNAIIHKEITAISSPQQWNDYKQTITLNVNTSGIVTAFTGIATAARSVVFVMAPETVSGSTMHLHEVQLG